MDEQMTMLPEPTATYGPIPIDDIIGWQEFPLDRAVAKSAAVLGIMVPIVVVADEDGFTVVDGRRRVAAARNIGLTEIPAAIWQRGEVNEDYGTLTANAVRAANEGVELDAILRLMNQGMTENQISRATGMATSTIRKRLKLQRLIPDMADALASGTISPSVAESASGLTAEQQQALVDGSHHGTGRITAKAVREARMVGTKDVWKTVGIEGLLDDSSEGEWTVRSALQEAARLADTPEVHRKITDLIASL